MPVQKVAVRRVGKVGEHGRADQPHPAFFLLQMNEGAMTHRDTSG